MSKLDIVKSWVIKNPVLNFFYQVLFYFELGKLQVGRFYGAVPEIIIIIGGIKYLLHIEFTTIVILILVFSAFTVFIIAGYVIKHFGLLDIDQEVSAMRNPIQKEMLEAARNINNHYRKKV